MYVFTKVFPLSIIKNLYSHVHPDNGLDKEKLVAPYKGTPHPGAGRHESGIP
jgi:hypothetical protein